jgi:hypothetical protein
MKLKTLFLGLAATASVAVVAYAQNMLPFYKHKQLPNLQLKLADGSTFTNANLDKKDKVIITVFDPLCDHCVDQLDEFRRNNYKLKNTHIIFMAPASKAEDAYKLSEMRQMQQFPTITLGVDQTQLTDTFYTVHGMPQSFLYNDQKQFIKLIHKEMPVDSFKLWLDR